MPYISICFFVWFPTDIFLKWWYLPLNHQFQDVFPLGVPHLWKLHFGNPRCLQPWMENRGSCPKCRSAIDAALDVAQKAASERWEDKQWVLEMMIWLGGSNGYGVLWVKTLVPVGTLGTLQLSLIGCSSAQMVIIGFDPSPNRYFFFQPYQKDDWLGWLVHMFGIRFQPTSQWWNGAKHDGCVPKMLVEWNTRGMSPLFESFQKMGVSCGPLIFVQQNIRKELPDDWIWMCMMCKDTDFVYHHYILSFIDAFIVSYIFGYIYTYISGISSDLICRVPFHWPGLKYDLPALDCEKKTWTQGGPKRWCQ